MENRELRSRRSDWVWRFGKTMYKKLRRKNETVLRRARGRIIAQTTAVLQRDGET